MYQRDAATETSSPQFTPEDIAMKFALSLSLIILLTSVSAHGEDSLVEKFESVAPASHFINHTVVSKDGVEVGVVSDIVLDREHGCVAFIAVRSKHSPNVIGNAYYLPPESIRCSDEQSHLNCTASFEQIERFGDLTKTGPMTLINPDSMAKLYKGYQATLYWKTAGETKKRLSLITVDELDGRIVRDTDWQILARVQEVLVEPRGKWRVAYLSLGELTSSEKDQRLAVPMAAFAQKSLSPTWLLDVPASAKLLKQTFKQGEWPTEVDRGWTEFVHVKYGTAPDGGLQDLRNASK